MSEAKMQEHIGQAVRQPLPRLHSLPATLPLEGAVRIELEGGAPVFRASNVIRNRIEDLVKKQRSGELSQAEEEELDRYEEVDDYLSLVNRMMRNVIQSERD
jgi:hypothetical protein